jgi:PhnB protein
MGSDAPPDRYERPKGISVSLNVKQPSEAERVFKALATDGQVTMPIQETFWAARFGMVTDRFGIPWMVNCEKSS